MMAAGDLSGSAPESCRRGFSLRIYIRPEIIGAELGMDNIFANVFCFWEV